MMSSLLFYHKKENPLTGVIDSEGCGGLKRFCSELSSALRTTSLRVKLANPKVGAPRPRRKGGKSRSRGGGRGREPPLPPFFLWGELFLLLLVRGEGKYEGAGAPHCAPGLTTHCALRTRAFPSVALSMHPLPQRDAYPSGCDGSRTRAIPGLQNPGLPPISTHPTILFWLGNLTQGRTDALCWPGASGSRGARPEPSLTKG